MWKKIRSYQITILEWSKLFHHIPQLSSSRSTKKCESRNGSTHNEVCCSRQHFSWKWVKLRKSPISRCQCVTRSHGWKLICSHSRNVDFWKTFRWEKLVGGVMERGGHKTTLILRFRCLSRLPIAVLLANRQNWIMRIIQLVRWLGCKILKKGKANNVLPWKGEFCWVWK